MKNLFGNIIKLFGSTTEESSVDDNFDDYELLLPENTSLKDDELFTQNFVNGGGHFLYCENQQEALLYLKEVIEREHISRMVCFDEKLQHLLNTINANYIDYPSASTDFNFFRCESLIAYDGSIMLSSHQTNGRKLFELQDNYIIYASPQQIRTNLGCALKIINRQKSDNLPSNITTIRGKEMHNMDDIPNAKNIYLLLVEDNL